MRWDDFLVGGVALVLAGLALASAMFRSPPTYRLRSIQAIEQRFGATAARLFLAGLALLLFSVGTAILIGARPHYAEEESETSWRLHSAD